MAGCSRKVKSMGNVEVIIYSKDFCPYCEGAKELFRSKGISFKEVNVSKDPKALDEIKKKTSHQTVPQIFVGGKFLGGFQEVKALDDAGKLDALLGAK